MRNQLEDTPQLLQHHSVVIWTNTKFAQVNVIPYRVESDLVAPNITRSMVPSYTETGLGRL